MIKINNSNIVGVSFGNTQFSKIYKGMDLYWRKSNSGSGDNNGDVDLSSFIISKGSELAGDVVLNFNEDNSKVFVRSVNLKHFKSGYTPIGIVVVPSSHNVYGTGENGVMGIKFASYSDPDNGTLSEMMYPCDYANSTLGDMNVVPSLGVQNAGEPSATIVGLDSNGELPRDENAFKYVCPTDPTTGYYSFTDRYDVFIPSPYLEDGSRNPQYSQTTAPMNNYNALSDFNGKGNTEYYINRGSQSDWKTNQIINQTSNNPSSKSCWRYKTVGTNQGDWYLPACGELGYAIPRIREIHRSLREINDVYNINVISFTTNIDSCYYQTSTKFRWDNMRSIILHIMPDFKSSNVVTKTAEQYVIPFIRITNNK